eukprot:2953553-Ditylum_brightwellii.AAC.1
MVCIVEVWQQSQRPIHKERARSHQRHCITESFSRKALSFFNTVTNLQFDSFRECFSIQTPCVFIQPRRVVVNIIQ